MRAASLVAAFITGTLFASFFALAWTGPTSAPPNGNASAPINVGNTDQVKNGGLALNSLAVFGNQILSGASRYLNFGPTAGSSDYGLRDNAGTMEFKNSSGSWSGIVSTSTTFAQIKFADGTTQTTAGGALTGTVGGGCDGNGTAWGNASGCSSTCNANGIGQCPAGYTARKADKTSSVACDGSGNCGCGRGNIIGTCRIGPCHGYFPSYYAPITLCIKN